MLTANQQLLLQGRVASGVMRGTESLPQPSPRGHGMAGAGDRGLPLQPPTSPPFLTGTVIGQPHGSRLLRTAQGFVVASGVPLAPGEAGAGAEGGGSGAGVGVGGGGLLESQAQPRHPQYPTQQQQRMEQVGHPAYQQAPEPTQEQQGPASLIASSGPGSSSSRDADFERRLQGLRTLLSSVGRSWSCIATPLCLHAGYGLHADTMLYLFFSAATDPPPYQCCLPCCCVFQPCFWVHAPCTGQARSECPR